MNKNILPLTALLLLVCGEASAFSFKDILTSENIESAVSTVVGAPVLSAKTLAGTWTYTSSAVKLESGNALSEIAGSVATTQIESQMDGALAKVGITSGLMSFTFGSDMTFSFSTKGRTLRGTYTVDSEEMITLNFMAVGALNIGKVATHAELSTTASTLSLLFNADKLMKIVDAVSSISGSETLQAANTLLQKYDGMLVGFDLKR